MRHLSLIEIQKARELSSPDNLKRCGNAYGVAMTYLPGLCDMSEAYLKARLAGGNKTVYKLAGDETRGWTILGSDGFEEFLGTGDPAKQKCLRILERLNGY